MFSEWFWKKVNWFAGCMALAALCGVALFLAHIEIKDMDLWLHLAVGRFITATGTIPHHDILSCTISGKPWLDHEWLFQVGIAEVYRLWGADGWVMMQVGIIAVTLVLLLLLGYRHDRQLVPITTLFLVFAAYQARMTHRPDIFSILFFITYVYLISRFLTRRWLYVAIVILQVIWTNMHGFFIMGPVLLGVGWFAEWAKRSLRLPYEWNAIGRLADTEYRSLRGLFFCSVLACFVNPYFAQGVWYPFSVLFTASAEAKVFFENIMELEKPITWATLFSMHNYVAFRSLILLSAGSFIYNRRKIDIAMLIVWALFLVLGLNAIRNIVFFAVAAYLAIIANTQEFSCASLVPERFRQKRFVEHGVGIILKILLFMWMVRYAEGLMLRGYFDFDTNTRKQEYAGGVSLRNYPTKAVDFLAANQVSGNFFNDFNSGAYLAGRMAPAIKVFIDGRTEAYGVEFFNNYQAIIKGDRDAFDAVVNTVRLTGALVSYAHQPVPIDIVKQLYANIEWVLVYFDYDAVIFLRDVEWNREIINRYRIDLRRWHARPVDIFTLGAQNVMPYQQLNRATVLYYLDFLPQAYGELLQALRIMPDYVEAHKLMGKIDISLGRYAQAFEHLRFVKSRDPLDMETRYCLARVLYAVNRFSDAHEECARAYVQHPNNKVKLLLAKILVKLKRYQDAFELVGEMDLSGGDFVEDVGALADEMRDAGAGMWAQKVYAIISRLEATAGLTQQ